MHTQESRDRYAWVIVLKHKTKAVRFLKEIKIPWWKGGGKRFVFVNKLTEATLMNHYEAANMLEIFDNSKRPRPYEVKPVGLVEES
jgi:hypothetical protein